MKKPGRVILKIIKIVLITTFICLLLLTVAFFAFLHMWSKQYDTSDRYDRVTNRMWNFVDEINGCNEVENCEFVFEKNNGPTKFTIFVTVNPNIATEDETYIFVLRNILYRLATDEALMRDFLNSVVSYNYISVVDENENSIINFRNEDVAECKMIVWSYQYGYTTNAFGHLIDSDGITIYKNFTWREHDCNYASECGLISENIVAYYTWDEVFDEEFSREAVMEQIYS